MNARTLVKRLDNTRVIPLYVVESKKEKKLKSTIYIKQSQGILPIKVDDILYCSAESNYTVIYKANGQKILVSKCLKYIEQQLHNPDFLRIHASFLVNKNHIQYVCFAQHAKVTIQNTELPIARSRKKLLKQQLTNLK